jgi:hypothetical protein
MVYDILNQKINVLKKVLIAGDSYAEIGPFSWSSLLTKKTGWSIKNIARRGTSLGWTYKQLAKENLLKFDNVIVIITDPNRIYTANSPHPCNLEMIDRFLRENNERAGDYEIHLAARHYYKYFFDPELALIQHEALLLKIHQMSDNIIFIRGIYDGNDLGFVKNDFNLIDVTRKEIEFLDKKLVKNIEKTYFENKFRMNHMIIENKNVFVEYINDMITIGHSNINMDDFVRLDENSFNKYFVEYHGVEK